MDSHKRQRAPSDSVRPHVPEEWVANSGLSLIWIDSILLVPLVFGVMFLPSPFRLIVLSVSIGVAVTFGILYSWARLHPTSTTAHLLEALHVGPSKVTR